MEITDVRIRLVEGENAERLRAFATIALDREFVVRDMKIIDGNNGLFVAMPSRRIMVRCQQCGAKNALRSRHCNDCGRRLPPPRGARDQGRPKEHVDVAHPITQVCRDRIHLAVINAYNQAQQRARSAGPAVPAAGEPAEDPVDSAPWLAREGWDPAV